jgi:hypothetical protein
VTELNIMSAGRSRNRHGLLNRRNLTVALAAVAGLLIPGLLASRPLTSRLITLTEIAWAEPATDAEPFNPVEGIEERRVIPVTIEQGRDLHHQRSGKGRQD